MHAFLAPQFQTIFFSSFPGIAKKKRDPRSKVYPEPGKCAVSKSVAHFIGHGNMLIVDMYILSNRHLAALHPALPQKILGENLLPIFSSARVAPSAREASSLR